MKKISDFVINKFMTKSLIFFIYLNYQVAWSPRRYCKYAVTNKPAIVTGTKPNTIPESKGSTIIEKKINETERY